MTARTLADIFAEEEPRQKQEKAPRRPPAVYRCYQGGFCRNCGEPLGVIETDGGRDRQYCDNNGKCRVAHHRKLKREKKRAEILQYHGELRDYWQNSGIRGEVLLRLQEILIQHGKAAAWAATDVVLLALAAQQQKGSNQNFRLIDDVMAGGEQIGFEELNFEDFRILAGFEAWSEFVSYASNASLMLVKAYLNARQHEEERKAKARKKLQEFENAIPLQEHVTK